MTSPAATRPRHHLFWVVNGGRIAHYCSRKAPQGALPTTPGVDIWSLRKQFPALSQWLSLRHDLHSGIAGGRSDIARALLEFDRPVERPSPAIRQAILGVMRLGPQQALAALAHKHDNTAAVLTPKFRSTLRALQNAFDPVFDLPFLTCQPNIYVWFPPDRGVHRRALVCFCTSSNTLNATLPVAHVALARYGYPICYIFNARGRFTYQGLPGHDTDDSARILKELLRKLGLTELYGLGTSLGGYTAVRYAHPMGLRRVLNFSGWPDQGSAPGASGDCMTKAAGVYPHSNVLSVLSRNDPNDVTIIDAYRRAGFATEFSLLESSTHGTFSAAIIENRLQDLINWLLIEH